MFSAAEPASGSAANVVRSSRSPISAETADVTAAAISADMTVSCPETASAAIAASCPPKLTMSRAATARTRPSKNRTRRMNSWACQPSSASPTATRIGPEPAAEATAPAATIGTPIASVTSTCIRPVAVV